MSYDVFFQGFKDGDAATGGGDAVRAMLEAYVTQSERSRRLPAVAATAAASTAVRG